MRELSHGIVELGDRHVLMYIEVSKIINLLKNWKSNRPADMLRVNEIKECLANGENISRSISCAEISSDHLSVYDGIHRIEALRAGLKEGIVNNDYIISLDCIFRSNHKEVKRNFININKSVSVSELYMEEEDVDLQLINDINALVKYYCEKYPKFCSASKKPYIPNFNRDVFNDEIYSLYKDLKAEIFDFNMEMLKQALADLNEKYAKESKKNPNSSQRGFDKMNKYGFFLFKERSLSRDDVRKIIGK